MKTGIYMIRNKVNDKKYIGQAVDIDTRWATHIRELNDNNHNNRYLQNSWNKYGADNFEFTIICLCEQDELDRLEIQYIAHFDTYNNGYNLTLGGNGCRGFKFTYEQRAKMSEYRKGKPKSEEFKAQISKSMKGRPKSEEWKIKHSESMKGKLRSEETKAKMSKNVYCVTSDTIYSSVTEAGEKSGVDPGTVSWCCQGKYTSGNGHIYKKLGLEFWYLDEYEEKFGKVAM